MKIAEPHKDLQLLVRHFRAIAVASGFTVICGLLFLFPLFVYSQEASFHFIHLGVEDGLPAGQVDDILVDDMGFTWFCTMEGLAKYDGRNFTNYTYADGDESTLSDFGATVAYQDTKGLIWVGTKKGLNCFDRSINAFTRYYPKKGVNSSSNHIISIFEDSRGRYWVGTLNGLFEFIPSEDGGEFFEIIWKETRSLPSVTTITECENDGIWAGTSRGLFRVDGDERTARQFLPRHYRSYFGIERWKIYSMVSGREGTYWISAEDGLRKWNSERPDDFIHVPLQPPNEFAPVKEVLEDGKGHLWIALHNDKGLLRMDIGSGEFTHFTFSPANRLGIGSNRLFDLAIDSLDNIWIATYTGVDRIFTGKRKFRLYQQKPGTGHPENLVYNAFAGPEGGFWFNTYDSRLFYSEAIGNRGREMVNIKDSIESLVSPGVDKSRLNSYLTNFHVLKFLQVAGGNIWLACAGQGVFLIDSTKKIRHLRLSGTRRDIFTCRLLEEDVDDSRFIWIGSNDGLWKVNKTTFEKEVYLPQRATYIVSGTQTPDGSIWLVLGDYYNGTLARFDKKREVFEDIQIRWDGMDNQAGMYVRQYAQTPGFLWLATPYGMGRIDLASKSFSLLRKKDGLVEEQLMGIAADKDGNVWLKSMRHISKYIPSQHTFWHFNIGEDMQEFNAVGATATQDGRIVFHGNNGFYAFSPERVMLDSSRPVVVLTGVKVMNESLDMGMAPELVTRIPALPYSQNMVTFEFAALFHSSPGRCRYKYQLEGVDPGWVESDGLRANYSNLAPGNYAFKVIAANAGGLWLPEEEGLKVYFEILTPWYHSWWAYSLYALTGFGLLYGWRRYELRQKAANAETRRLHELDEVKTHFYTNITHEFRTPLTVINGMAERLYKKAGFEAREGLKLINRNGLHLLGLVNQMLDMAKLESNSMPVNMAQGDVVLFLKYMLESFRSLASSKKIALRFSTSADSLFMDYDVEKLRQIVSNLLSNAIKFVPEGAEVTLRATALGKRLRIEVEDNGRGIPPDQLDRIFERFYQVDDTVTRPGEGTGIGLTLTRELVKLFGGEIFAESEPGKGTRFTVLMPVSRKAVIQPTLFTKGDLADAAQLPESKSRLFHQPPIIRGPSSTVLIIEDNADVVHYITQVLQESYILLTAPNGKAGIESARKNMPDIILSDVMMPEMDGYEVCRQLKSGLQTSHIPIVLLTAKADTQSRIEGLEQGADAYLSKPFNEMELRVRLKKLIENREKLREYYSSGVFITGKEGAATARPALAPQDEKLLKEFLRAVEGHLDDPGLSAKRMSGLLHMSYHTLYQKLHALTGMGVTEYIRHIRLHKAASMLRELPKMTVSETAFKVGFSSPSYFTRRFKEVFKISPSKWCR